MPKETSINAVAFREGDVWVVQGIEYDIVAHAANLDALPMAFMRAVIENACISVHLGREPLAGIKPAPERFRRLFDQASVEVSPVKPVDREPLLPSSDIRVRVTERLRAA